MKIGLPFRRQSPDVDADMALRYRMPQPTAIQRGSAEHDRACRWNLRTSHTAIFSAQPSWASGREGASLKLGRGSASRNLGSGLTLGGWERPEGRQHRAPTQARAARGLPSVSQADNLKC